MGEVDTRVPSVQILRVCSILHLRQEVWNRNLQYASSFRLESLLVDDREDFLLVLHLDENEHVELLQTTPIRVMQ